MKKCRVFIAMLLAMVISITTCVSASAATSWYYTTQNEIDYKCQGSCEVNAYAVSSNTRAETVHGDHLPANYMCLVATLYNSNNELVASTGMRYNPSGAYTMSVHATSSVTGTYHSIGMALFYTGSVNSSGNYNYSGFNLIDPIYQYYASSSSSSSPAPLSIQPSAAYQVNRDGLTYGSGMSYELCGEYPDLIQAVGTNGNSGYVRNTDVMYIAKDTEDAAEYSKTVEGSTIPVYDIDGNIIDTFILTGTCEINA